MKISQLCLKLKAYFICSFLYSDPESDIYTFKPLKNETQPGKDILYIASGLPEEQEKSPAPINLLIFSDTDIFLSDIRMLYPNSNIILAEKQTGDSADSLFDIVSEIFLRENRFAAQINHLSNISSSNRGMQALIDEASRILDAPIVVIDSSYRVMVMSTCTIPDEEHLEEQRRTGTLTERTLQRLRRDRIFEQIRKKPDRMHFCIAPDATHWWMNMLVYVQGIEVAEIGIMEHGRKFTEYDIEIMKHLRYLLSLEIQRGNTFGANYGFAHSLLVTDLLEQKFTNLDVVRHRTKLLGWQPASLHSVMTVFPNRNQNDVPKHFHRQCEILAPQITRLMTTAYWRVSDKDLVFIIPMDKRKPDDSAFLPRLCELLKSNQMTAIVSNPFTSLLDVRKGYEQTVSLYNLREYFAGESPFYRYEDHFILHIASILQETHDLHGFYHPYVLMLRDYDKKNRTEFVRTLYEYLTYIDNPAAIAKHLHIHKNTLYYRINKLRELFPIDLNDGRMRLHIQLTIELMRLERERIE